MENQENNKPPMNPNVKSVLIFAIVFIIAFFGTRALMAYFK